MKQTVVINIISFYLTYLQSKMLTAFSLNVADYLAFITVISEVVSSLTYELELILPVKVAILYAYDYLYFS